MSLPVNQELLDVVDDDDRVIGVKTRGEIHSQGLMHRAVHILVFNSAGEIFIQKRSMSKDENPGQWDTSCAGHVDSGETYFDCAIRELEEELGIMPAPVLKLQFHVSPTAQNGMEHSPVYSCIYDGELCLQEEEIDAGEWLGEHEMDNLVSEAGSNLTGILRFIWRRYRGRKGI
ncbi:MAG: NUDIX domain-containing protein [Gammaproteobacteria bacterium]|nr:NUDIX domain-containing protein [Gammaproteobacteria bacterium]